MRPFQAKESEVGGWRQRRALPSRRAFGGAASFFCKNKHNQQLLHLLHYTPRHSKEDGLQARSAVPPANAKLTRVPS